MSKTDLSLILGMSSIVLSILIATLGPLVGLVVASFLLGLGTGVSIGIYLASHYRLTKRITPGR